MAQNDSVLIVITYFHYMSIFFVTLFRDATSFMLLDKDSGTKKY